MAVTAANSLDVVDDVTADLIIQLQLEDIERINSACKGKAREGDQSDAEHALCLYKRELEVIGLTVSDRRMTRSIARAVQTDGIVLAECQSQETRAVRDRHIATEMSGERVSSDTVPTFAEEDINDELLTKMAALYVSGLGEGQEPSQFISQYDVGDVKGESSVSLARGRATQSSNSRLCEACQEEKWFFDVARVACNHQYCRGCLQELFNSSMTDESLFPPRCCRQPITIASARMFLSHEVVLNFERKKIEYSTEDRTYCSRPTCSAFIPFEKRQGDNASCRDCGMVTCTICKSMAHDGDCPEDNALQRVLETAAENGWQRCYSCRRIVELDTGCNHMT